MRVVEVELFEESRFVEVHFDEIHFVFVHKRGDLFVVDVVILKIRVRFLVELVERRGDRRVHDVSNVDMIQRSHQI
ncbi:MAG: hypothetical protein J0H34_14570, partial [Rhizobiales bacterium]|nr:hypothetical protein [Hyphomicrobiales bacterium]